MTGEDLASAAVSTHVYHWSDEVAKILVETGVPLSNSYELCLEFDQNELGCGYYIVDHSKRSIFWLETVSTENVGMNPAFSQEHLRECTPPLNHCSSHHRFLLLGSGLEEMYWLHVEFYPCHSGIPTNGIIDDLLNTLAHARGGTRIRNNFGVVVFLKRVLDALTSNVSTFPYSAEESARFTELIQPYQGKQVDGHVICVVARLNSFIGAFTALF